MFYTATGSAQSLIESDIFPLSSFTFKTVIGMPVLLDKPGASAGFAVCIQYLSFIDRNKFRRP